MSSLFTGQLESEIGMSRQSIKTDTYGMSIGEWINLYNSRDIIINPEFQRYFRWQPSQKSRLIESILLGIPIPPIYVSEREDGVWEVIDGLQRLSTILEFVGILRNVSDDGAEFVAPPLVLEKTKYLPALEGKLWADERSGLSPSQQRLFNRQKLQVVIIQKESDSKAKYELFQRLNTGGTPLTEQEVRNAILSMVNRRFLNMLEELSGDENFVEVTRLTDRQATEQYDKELVLRLIVFRHTEEEDLKAIKDVGQYLDDRMLQLADDPQFDYDAEAAAFRCTFRILRETARENAFRKWDLARQRFIGGFSIAAFEVVAAGVAYHCEGEVYAGNQDIIVQQIQSLATNDTYNQYSGSGVRFSTRGQRLIPLGRELFGPADPN